MSTPTREGIVPWLCLEGVSVRYGAVEALRRVSLQLGERDRLAVVGPSGSGKTTLLLAICGLVPLSEGHIRLAGRTLDGLPPWERNVSMVFQDGALFPHLTAFQNIELALMSSRLPRHQRHEKVQWIADVVGVRHVLDRRPSQMSGGEARRVALARALVRRPHLWLLDEPFASLDPPLRHRLLEETLRLHRTLAVPLIYVTHEQHEAMAAATQVAVLAEGRVRQVGSPAQIYDEPADLFVARFVGFPPMNVIPWPQLPADLRSCLPTPPRPPEQLVVGFRPEAVRVEAGGEATLVQRQVVGPEQHLTFAYGSLEVRVRLARGQRVDGETFRLSLPRGMYHLFDTSSQERIA